MSRLAIWILFLLVGCGTSDTTTAVPDPLRVGILPDQTPATLRAQYEPLIEYLGSATGLALELVVADDYGHLVELLHGEEVHLAWLGGLTFLRTDESKVRPLVMRDVDLLFTSDYLVAASATERSVEELAGRTFAFGPRLSTSGHLSPRHDLHERGIVPEEFFGDVRYSEGHDQTADWVANGEVDLGVANSVIVEAMLRDGRLSTDRIRILGRTPPYRNYVWVVQTGLAPDLQVRLQDAFLALDVTVEEHAAILTRLGGRGFVPASRADYAKLRVMAEHAGLLTAEVSR